MCNIMYYYIYIIIYISIPQLDMFYVIHITKHSPGQPPGLQAPPQDLWCGVVWCGM